MVEDDGAGVVQAAGVADLLDLAGAGEGGGIGAVAAAADDLDDVGARALDEARGFLGAIGAVGRRRVPMSRHTRIARARLCGPGRPGARQDSLRVFKRDRHRPRRHHRRDGVLVDHLRHGVLEEHDVLVERFDLALQLDAVHQVDRDRDMFLAQGVEERVLEQLPLVAHCYCPF